MGPRDLVEKYAELRALRTTAEPDPRPRLRALAARFPGALRELDALPLEEIDARLAALREVVGGGAREAEWMTVACAFHEAMRDELDRARARAPGRRRSALVWARLAERFGRPEGELARLLFG